MSVRSRPRGQWTRFWAGYRGGTTVVASTDVAILDLAPDVVDDAQGWSLAPAALAVTAALVVATAVTTSQGDDVVAQPVVEESEWLTRPVAAVVTSRAGISQAEDEFAPASTVLDETGWAVWPSRPLTRPPAALCVDDDLPPQPVGALTFDPVDEWTCRVHWRVSVWQPARLCVDDAEPVSVASVALRSPAVEVGVQSPLDAAVSGLAENLSTQVSAAVPLDLDVEVQ